MNSGIHMIRKIIHIDMDAFYASVEQRDQPWLKEKPVIVGGDPNGRGVVAACSYEARKFGIHSAMSCAKAYQLCPQAAFIRPRFDVYKSVSRQIRDLFYEYTQLVEPLSLDEAYLDVTENKKCMPSATRIAQEILREIYRRTGGLTASAGVSFNKFLAKVATDVRKPAGLTVVTPSLAQDFIDRLPIRKFFGVGRVTEQKMMQFGIKTGADLKRFDREELVRRFGKAGQYFHDIAHGRDERPVKPDRIRKSIGKEITLVQDIDDTGQMLGILRPLTVRVSEIAQREERKGHTLTLKVKFFDFQSVTRSATFTKPVTDVPMMMHHIGRLLATTGVDRKKVRLLGVSLSNFEDQREKEKEKVCIQLPLPLIFKTEPF